MSDNDKCYYGCNSDAGTWTCLTCQEHYCLNHWHKTTRGKNVECVACEHARYDNKKAALSHGWYAVAKDELPEPLKERTKDAPGNFAVYDPHDPDLPCFVGHDFDALFKLAADKISQDVYGT